MKADRSTLATRTPWREVRPGTYVCRRCGIVRQYRSSARKPERCQDCQDVERGIQ